MVSCPVCELVSVAGSSDVVGACEGAGGANSVSSWYGKMGVIGVNMLAAGCSGGPAVLEVLCSGKGIS